MRVSERGDTSLPGYISYTRWTASRISGIFGTRTHLRGYSMGRTDFLFATPTFLTVNTGLKLHTFTGEICTLGWGAGRQDAGAS